MIILCVIAVNHVRAQIVYRYIDLKVKIITPAANDTFYDDSQWHPLLFRIYNLGPDIILAGDHFNFNIFITYTRGMGTYTFQSDLLPGDSTIRHTSFITKDRPNLEENRLCVTVASGLQGGIANTPVLPTSVVVKSTDCIPIIFHIPDRTKFFDDLPYTDTLYMDSVPRYEFSVYPNPTQTNLNIRLTDRTVSLQSVEMIDMIGKSWNIDFEPKGDALYQINMNQILNGMYYLVIRTNRAVHRQKVFKD